MQIAPYPPNEGDRLRFLRSLEVLDTAAEESFDRVTRVVAELLQVPTALISLVDADRQWFKSKVGLEAQEGPRDISFCAHTLHVETALIIPDTHNDLRFHDNPTVMGPPYVRFYAGIPLRTADGLTVGTLCAVDYRPRTFPESTFAALADLARIVEHELFQRAALGAAKVVQAEERQGRMFNERRFAAIFENTPSGKAVVDLQGRITLVNRKLCAITGYSSEELLAKSLAEITYSDDIKKDLVEIGELFSRKRDSYEVEKRYIRKNGTLVWVALNVAMVRDEVGMPVHFIVVALDISDRKRNEAFMDRYHEELERRIVERTSDFMRSQETLQTIADSFPILIAQIDTRLRYIFNNAQYREIFGVEPATLRGKAVSDFLAPDVYQRLLPYFQRALRGERTAADDICYDISDGRIWNATYIPQRREGKVVGFFVMSQDVSERKRVEQALIDRAMIDSLTGLPNRSAMLEKLTANIAISQKGTAGFALFFLDLDGFKQVNDGHGHEVGDEVLRHVAVRLKKAVRQQDFVSRWAGDEFVIIADVSNPSICKRIGSSICEALSEPFKLASATVHIGTSIGIAICPPFSKIDADELLSYADAAMYESKRMGKNCFQFSKALPSLRTHP
ncbi:diguanylate cyclase [Pseudomonas psychrotolerans]|uniref:sensor domain-containing diguanylate cyclase n=1 Tax=Pseudomonas oryzihabitans TaxID=47885 RepID=UPI0015E4931C|nr:PAS domain S-box protein [Pseudomonas psychrotolerans]MBA1180071.1 diguanylate cyclase [Pseudomonas psychrotolerans]MBA1211185.1 diguanylate cyclase [Pseudomonas psychrotolerans]